MRVNKHKFSAKSVLRDGIKVPSQLHGRYYDRLRLLKKCGEVLFFLREVPFDLPGGVKHFVDFQEFWVNGDIKFVEVKGFETPEWIMKKKMVETLYPIEIVVMKKGDF